MKIVEIEIFFFSRAITLHFHFSRTNWDGIDFLLALLHVGFPETVARAFLFFFVFFLDCLIFFCFRFRRFTFGVFCEWFFFLLALRLALVPRSFRDVEKSATGLPATSGRGKVFSFFFIFGIRKWGRTEIFLLFFRRG